MRSSQHAHGFAGDEANEQSALTQSQELAKSAVDDDPSVDDSVARRGVPRGRVLLALAVASWSIVVIGAVILLRWAFRL